MTQAPAGRLKSAFQCESVAPLGLAMLRTLSPRSRTGLISNVPLERRSEILFLNIYTSVSLW